MGCGDGSDQRSFADEGMVSDRVVRGYFLGQRGRGLVVV